MKKYSREEVDAILARALRAKDDGMTHEELVAAAKEVGVSEEAIANAAEEIEREGMLSRETQAARKRQIRAFFSHFWAYAVVIGALAIMNIYFIGGPPYWFQWPLLGWGIGIAMHLRRVLSPDMERLRDKERRRLQWRERHERRRVKDEKKVRVEDRTDDREEDIEDEHEHDREDDLEEKQPRRVQR